MLQPHAHREAVTVDRREGPYGEIVLRRRDTHFEIIANGTFLMDTSDGRSERLLVDAALQALDPAIAAPHLLIGGLGVGFSLARAAARPRWHRISVVERDPAVVDWHRQGHLAPYSEGALDDPRVALVAEDLVAHLLRTADTPGSEYGAGAVRRAVPGHRQRAGLDSHREQRQSLQSQRPGRLPGPAEPGRCPRRMVGAAFGGVRDGAAGRGVHPGVHAGGSGEARGAGRGACSCQGVKAS